MRDYYTCQQEWFDRAYQWKMPVMHGVTVDDPDCRDKDDAIACERLDSNLYVVNVAIANVAATVPVDSPAFEYAQKKVRSQYGYQNDYMLPVGITEHLCSLNPGEQKPTIGYSFHIDTKNKTVDYEIGEAIFQSQASHSYEHFSKIDDVRVFFKPIECIREQRLDACAYAPAEDHIPLVQGDPRTGHTIVRELMLLTNAVTADQEKEDDIPHIYRTPKRKSPSGLYEVYTCDPEAPTETGYGAYAHNSSPIRRLPDLANQYNLVRSLRDQDPVLNHDMLSYIAYLSNEHEFMANARTMRLGDPRDPRSTRPQWNNRFKKGF